MRTIAFWMMVMLPAGVLAQSTQPATQGKTSDLERRLVEQEKRLVEQQKRIEKLEQRETSGIEESPKEATESKLLSVWGFFDLTLNKAFYDANSPYNIFSAQHLTFVMSNVNVYIGSQMTETLSALLEVRFSFLPHGQDEDFEFVDIPQSQYLRTDTTVWDPTTSFNYRQGGVTLERVHLTYSPVDWLNVIAGRFLTPYGIWNVDHGTPVVLPPVVPYTITWELVPQAQTGLQIYGRFFLMDELLLDYAVTLSNGRGPMDEVLDLDDDKAVGLRLKLTFEGKDVRTAAGVYAYYGTYTNRKKVVDLVLTEDLTLDPNVDKPLQVENEKTEEYREFVIASDLKIEAYGVLLQGEFIWKRVDVSKPPVADPTYALFSGATPLETVYLPTYTGYSFYILLGYELPLLRWIRPVRITPYFMFEYTDPNDVLPVMKFRVISGGINIRPSPYVVIKIVGYGFFPKADRYFGSPLRGVLGQMAVSF